MFLVNRKLPLLTSSTMTCSCSKIILAIHSFMFPCQLPWNVDMEQFWEILWSLLIICMFLRQEAYIYSKKGCMFLNNLRYFCFETSLQYKIYPMESVVQSPSKFPSPTAPVGPPNKQPLNLYLIFVICNLSLTSSLAFLNALWILVSSPSSISKFWQEKTYNQIIKER